MLLMEIFIEKDAVQWSFESDIFLNNTERLELRTEKTSEGASNSGKMDP